MPGRLQVTTESIIEAIIREHGCDVTTQQVRDYSIAAGYTPSTILNRLSSYKSGRGKYTLQQIEKLEETFAAAPAPVGKVQNESVEYSSLVPATDGNFVPFGNFTDLKKVIKSKVFYPLFITGLSGNGKTHGVEQACSQLNRDMVRVNVTIETDEDDLIGGFRLVNGETVWHDGPVVEALKRGAILLLDEVDLASNKIMCLQSLLEGKGVYLKKVNQYVKPAAGFNVVATANTKGRGSDDGKFIGTNILNEAFLERFAVTFEQEYPTPAIESKILTKFFHSECQAGDSIAKIVSDLTVWADIIRKTYQDGGVDEVISTRRLLNICKAFNIFGNITKAIELSTNRFDDETQKVFTDLYEKVSGEERSEDIIVDGEKVGEVKF